MSEFLETASAGRRGPVAQLIAIDFSALDTSEVASRVRDLLSGIDGNVLLFGLAEGSDAGTRLSAVSGDAFGGVASLADTERVYDVGAEMPHATEPLTGARIHARTAPHDLALVPGAREAAVETIVAVNGRPLFARATVGRGRLYVLATTDVLDVHRPIDRLNEVLSFSLFAPVLMLLREVFGDALWHTSRRFASLVIDDPPLQPNYGYLNYRRLADSLASDGFAATVAFVPYNYRRTRARTARLVSSTDSRLSLCVHGCDHVRGEFASRDAHELRAKIATGLSRMEAHRKRRGTDFARVMVFPGGRFSDEAMRSLADAGFDAVVNSTPYPRDGAPLLPMGTFLLPAVERYPGLPLLLRRYPVAATHFQIESFLGKPALIAAHPADFKDGFGRIRHVVRRLNASEAPPAWAGLGEIVEQLHVERERNGRTQVRAIFPRVALSNDSDEERTYTVFARDTEGTVVARTRWGGALPSRRLHGWRATQVVLAPHSSVALELSAPREEFVERVSYSLPERVRAQARRGMWELRDRVLVRSDSLSNLARRVSGGL